MVIVRYADDAIFDFESETDARRFLDAMRERLAALALTLHPDKTRLIEFGRFAAAGHGFRPQRSPHSALAALDKASMMQRVNFVLDVDIRTFFDSVDHGWLMRMVAHRIADPRVLRLIERWLGAGVLESGQWKAVEAGTPQGSGISPILANVFLHYVVDLWVHQWRRRRAAGQVIVCRYADDMVLGCQFEADGKQFLADLKDRLAQFGLSLHEGKTRLIEFGRSAARNRAAAGRRRPETFDFLGFTHYCGKTRSNRFTVKRKTQAKRLVRKLAGSKEDVETVRAFFQDLRTRGLGDPLLIVSDGAPGTGGGHPRRLRRCPSERVHLF